MYCKQNTVKRTITELSPTLSYLIEIGSVTNEPVMTSEFIFTLKDEVTLPDIEMRDKADVIITHSVVTDKFDNTILIITITTKSIGVEPLANPILINHTETTDELNKYFSLTDDERKAIRYFDSVFCSSEELRTDATSILRFLSGLLMKVRGKEGVKDARAIIGYILDELVIISMYGIMPLP